MSLKNILPTCSQQKTNYFEEEPSKQRDTRPNQCFLINEELVKNISGFDYQEPTIECPKCLEWYPFVNSYYNHTEDVDALGRVNELLATKPSFLSDTSLPDDVEYYETDAYCEKDAQLQYLYSKPISFLILGKPDIGQQQLGRKLAEYWKCVYLDPETLINDEIRSGSRVGECIEFNLRCGRAIGIDVTLRLLEKRIKTQSVQHRGFVLCGMPIVPNDLYEEDPVSSESAIFNIHEIFEELLDTAIEIGVPPEKKHVSLSSKAKTDDVEDEELAALEELPGEDVIVEDQPQVPQLFPTNANSSMIDLGSAGGNICKEPEIGMNYAEQLKIIFSLLQEPFILVYVKCENGDVVAKRSDYRYDILTGSNIDFQELKTNSMVHSLFSNEPDAADFVNPEDFFEEIRHPDVSKMDNLVHLPHNFPANILSQLKLYREQALPVIEEHVLLHDPQFFIKLDGRLSPHRMFNLLKARLEILPIQKVVLPERFQVTNVAIGGEDVVETDENITYEDAYKKILREKLPGKIFKWKWSDWGVKCPVSMKEGYYQDGSPEIPVQFMNRIFFLTDEAAFLKFSRNPRPYLFPPYPKPSCRVFVFGPNSSGKTTVSKCISYLLNGIVLDPKEMRCNYIELKKKEEVEKEKQKYIIEGINMLDNMRFELKERRDKIIVVWAEKLRKHLDEKLAQFTEDASDDKSKSSGDYPVPSECLCESCCAGIQSLCGIEDERYEVTEPLEEIDFSRISKFKNVENCRSYLDEPKKLVEFLPKEYTFVEEPATVLDDFVKVYADNAVLGFQPEITLTDEDIVDMFTSNIREVEERNNRCGWIIDGMPVDFVLLNSIDPSCYADDILILKDEEGTLKHLEPGKRVVFRKFRDFFADIGNTDAAWRSPDTESSSSIRDQFIRNILYGVTENEELFKDHPSQQSQSDESTREPEIGSKSSVVKMPSSPELGSSHDEMDTLIKFLNEKEISYTEINISDKSIIDVLKEVVRYIEDQYRQKAEPMTDEDRIEEMNDFAVEQVADEEMFEDRQEQDGNISFEKGRRYGDTSYYCPVSFINYGVFWRGKEEFAVKFEDKINLLAKENFMNDFIINPKNYTFGNKQLKKIPAPRVCVVGVTSAGKTTIAKALAENLAVHYVDFNEFLKTDIGFSDEDIINFLKSDDPSEDLIEKFATKLWRSEPIKSGGFILDNFPRNSTDLAFMVNNTFIPDLFLQVSVDSEILKQRLLTVALEEWKLNRYYEEEQLKRDNSKIREEWEMNRRKRFNEMMEERRQERYQKRSKSSKSNIPAEAGDNFNVSGTDSQISFDSVAEQQDSDDIMKILDDEMPEPKFDHDLETFEQATERIETTIENNLSFGIDTIIAMKELCEAELIDWIQLNGNLKKHCTVYQSHNATEYLKNRNFSVLERCYDVSLEVAEQLLSCGYYFLSKFGKTCPVQYFDNSIPIQMYFPAKSNQSIYPVIHRQYIYFIVGEKSYEIFLQDPLKYVFVKKVNFPLITYRVAVVGPPKSGKTYFAQRIQDEYDFKVISGGQAVRYVLRYLPLSVLAVAVEDDLRNGLEVRDDLLVKCLEAANFNAKSITQGVVIDGLPVNKNQSDCLQDRGLTPHLIIRLDASHKEIYERVSSMPDPTEIPIAKNCLLKYRLNEWEAVFKDFGPWVLREYQNLAAIDACSSKWKTWKESKCLMLAVFSEIRHYFIHAKDDWPLRIANMLITPLEYLERESSYKSYCPICLLKQKLKTGGDPPDRTTLIHFRQYFYWLCHEHIEQFLKCPEKYLSPYNTQKLPQNLPQKKYLHSVPSNVFENGICVVCYSKNRRKKIFTEGVLNFAVEYINRTYLFDSKECMREFLSEPGVFSGLEVNYRDPENMSSLKYEELPVLGLLEQFVADDIIKALNHVVDERPLIPGLSISTSAAIEIGLFLKISSKKREYSELYRRAKELCDERKNKVPKYLNLMKQTVSPYVYCDEIIPPFDERPKTMTVGKMALEILEGVLDKINYSGHDPRFVTWI